MTVKTTRGGFKDNYFDFSVEDLAEDLTNEFLTEHFGDSYKYFAIKQVNPASVEYLDARMEDLQRELIDRTERHENYDDLAEEILRLRQYARQLNRQNVA